jgi:deoxyribodipyrimidine photo-lyase
MDSPVNIFWFRRDLRLHDNAGLFYALRSGKPIIPVFVFDRNILDDLEDRTDRRVEFIYKSLEAIQKKLVAAGSTLLTYYGTPEEMFQQLVSEYQIAQVFTNRDYEPYARQRDAAIGKILKDKSIDFITCKDQVIFEKDEVIKEDGTPYTIFTPYSKKWKAAIHEKSFASFASEKSLGNFHQAQSKPVTGLASMNFSVWGKSFPSPVFDKGLIKHYHETRDMPGIEGTSHLGIHLRFGTVSIRQLAKEATALNETFLNELIWRDFYHMILWHFPQVQSHSFKPAFDNIRWRNDEKEFDAWCNGKTGYPIVDAGMRELNETGFMHNRVRMITASFLTKHLLCDWRLGEAYFAKKLLDYDLAANNGGWQWAAGSGCDAAPYFRIFNPYLQTKKFDADGTYIGKWIPELNELSYPLPIVDHEMARKRCLEVYSEALKK